MNYKETAEQIVNAVGGRSNISGLTHCVTRLRFVLVDEGKADTELIKSLPGVMGVIRQGGQYQVVIGNEVTNVFDEVAEITDIGSAVDGTKEEKSEGSKKGLWERIISAISGIFTPLLPVFAACGILKGLLSLCTGTGILNGTEGVYTVLYAIADSIFYFFPVVVGAAAAERFKLNKYVGMIIGAAMMYPSIITAASSGESFSFLGIPMMLFNYSSSIFPAILAVFAASYINKLAKKICPKTIAYFGVPFITISITVILALLIIGPAMLGLSYVLATAMNAVYSFSPVLCALLLGGPWVVLVMLGLHWAFIPIFLLELTSNGSCSMMGLFAANQFAMAGAMFAVALKVGKDANMKNLGITSAITCILGISEPGIYGVLLPLKTPFIMSIIAGSIGAVPAALMGTAVYSFSASGIFGIPGFINPAGIDAGFYGAIISSIAGFVLGFILTYIISKNTKEA